MNIEVYWLIVYFRSLISIQVTIFNVVQSEHAVFIPMVSWAGREIRNLELLKLRFDETMLHTCQVMLKDITDSKRINSHIQTTIETPENGIFLHLLFIFSFYLRQYFSYFYLLSNFKREY